MINIYGRSLYCQRFVTGFEQFAFIGFSQQAVLLNQEMLFIAYFNKGTKLPQCRSRTSNVTINGQKVPCVVKLVVNEKF